MCQRDHEPEPYHAGGMPVIVCDDVSPDLFGVIVNHESLGITSEAVA